MTNFRKSFDPSLYFVADPEVCAGRPIGDVIRKAALGGVTMVQLRFKSDELLPFLDMARDIGRILSPMNIPFIINDNVAVAQAVNADGVHLGQDDMMPDIARSLLGPDKIIGVTAFEEHHFKALPKNIVDYAGTGPFFSTLTKPDKPVLGPDNFRKLVMLSDIPVIGIGGITAQNADQVIRQGASGLAMMRAISESPSPETAARTLKEAIKKARLEKDRA